MFSKNKTQYIILLVGVLFCLYTLLTVKSYEVDCNNYWFDQINNSLCARSCFNIGGDPYYTLYEEGVKFPIINGEVEWGAKEKE